MTAGFPTRHGISSPASVVTLEGPVSPHASVARVSDGGRYVCFGRRDYRPTANSETRAALRTAAAVTSGCQAVRCSEALPIFERARKVP